VFVVGLLVAILIGWAYEASAIRWRKWPTITAIIHNTRDHLLVASGVVLTIVALAAWAIWHLLVEGSGSL
jgi:hypothetical protein